MSATPSISKRSPFIPTTAAVASERRWSCECASGRRFIGYASVTLTTFRDVSWNMPFYAKLGFSVVPPHTLSAGLRAVVDDETRRGLDSSRRVVMKRPSDAVQG